MLTVQQYQHPRDPSNTLHLICGYDDLLKEAQSISLEKVNNHIITSLTGNRPGTTALQTSLPSENKWLMPSPNSTTSLIQFQHPTKRRSPANFTDLAAEARAKETNEPEQIYN
jgi:hypothetical protein